MPVEAFERGSNESGLLTISSHLPCNHACLVFVDQQAKMRGGQCADLTIDARAAPATLASPNDEDVLALLLAKVLAMDARDTPAFSSMGAGGKLEAIESALLHGDVPGASSIVMDVQAFADGIGETDVVLHLQGVGKLLDAFMAEKQGVVFTRPAGSDATGFTAAIHARAGAVKAGLDYMAMEGAVTRDLVQLALDRLNTIVDRARG